MLLVSCLLGLVVALIVFLTLRKRKNPEKWVRNNLALIGMVNKEIDFWVAVSKFETDNYTSSLAKNYYNIFGMGVPTKRDSLRNGQVFMSGDNQDFSTYSDYPTCVNDLILWMAYDKFPLDITDLDVFVTTMKSKGYFTAPAGNYLAGLKLYL